MSLRMNGCIIASSVTCCRYYNWNTAAPVMLAMQVYQKPLPQVRPPQWYTSIYSWFFPFDMNATNSALSKTVKTDLYVLLYLINKMCKWRVLFFCLKQCVKPHFALMNIHYFGYYLLLYSILLFVIWCVCCVAMLWTTFTPEHFWHFTIYP